MDTTLLINLSGQTYERLDLFEDIPITLTIQQSDLTNLTGRRVPYSNTIEIPDTSNNGILFEHYYEVNGVDFNPLIKIPCVVQYRGSDVFNGIMRMNAVINKPEGRIYEIFITGEVIDFFSQIRDYTLQDLNWTDLQHKVSYSAITTSWEAEPGTTNGLFQGQILYPLINYGLIYSGDSTTPLFTYDFTGPKSFTTTGGTVSINSFKPSVKLKTVLDKIFDITDFTYVSEFFDTDYFNSIYMDTFQDGQVGVIPQSAITNQNIFFVQASPQYNYQGGVIRDIEWYDNGPKGYDPLNIFNNTNSSFLATYPGDYFFNFRLNIRALDNFVTGSIAFRAYKYTNPQSPYTGTIVYQSPNYDLFTNTQNVDQYFSATCNAGEYIKLVVVEGIFPIYLPNGNIRNRGLYKLQGITTSGIAEPLPFWDLYNSPILLTGETINLQQGISNMNSQDFIKGLITMFNLIVVQDEESRQIRFEPYNWYYNDNDRNKVNWTDRIDLGSEYRIEPLSFDLPKQNVWTYDFADNEYLNKIYTDTTDQIYGRFKYINESNIFTGEKEYLIPFAPLPTSGTTGAENFIIPQCYYLINGLQTPYATKPHVFFWTGNRYAYKDQYKTVPGYWYLQGDTGPELMTTYPCVSHLSSLDIQIPSLVSDLNFQSTFDFFGNTNTQPVQFTEYNLYNVFWRDYVENLYSNESRRLICRVFFNPILLYQTSLKDSIFIKDANYTIEKITDGDYTNFKMTQVSLIKNKTPYYRIDPPPPVYGIEWNQPYPTVEPAYEFTCYVSFDKDEVCSSTAPIINLTSFGPTLNNFDKVYYDTGTSLALLPQGNYLRLQTSPPSDMFVVIDNYGRILEQTC